MKVLLRYYYGLVLLLKMLLKIIDFELLARNYSSSSWVSQNWHQKLRKTADMLSKFCMRFIK